MSPAYFLSRFGESFGPDHVASALADVRSLDPDGTLGLAYYEPEVFDPICVADWTDAAEDPVAAIGSLGPLIRDTHRCGFRPAEHAQSVYRRSIDHIRKTLERTVAAS